MADRYENIRKALAMGPTPGPTVVRFRRDGSSYISIGDPIKGPHKQFDLALCKGQDNDEADAAHIAACDPDTIRALLAERDALEAAREDAERLDWLSQHDVGVGDLGYGEYQWYAYAKPFPEHGMPGLRTAIGQARGKENGNG